MRTIRDPEAVPRAVANLAELHRERAEQGRGVEYHGHLEGPAQVAFLHDLMARLAAEGRAFVEDGESLMVCYSGYR